ncbi:MAG TPA: DUF222 domain-containing protein [Pseudonocardiaceae bacterium]
MEKSADALFATEWWRATDADLLAAVRAAEEASRRVYATTLAIHAEVQARGLTTGHDSIRAVVHEAARVPITEATRRENHAELLQHSEVTRAAVVEGAIGADHLEVIVRTLAKIPANVDAEQRELAESMLVEHARELDAGALRRAARHILDWLDQDGAEPADPPEPPVNDLHVDTMRNGEVRFTGHLGPEAGTLLVGLLSPLAKPRSVDGVPDLRGVGERHGDAFAELLQLIANAAAAPIDGGERPHLTLTMSLQDLRAQIGHAQLGGVADLGSLTARQARRLACDAKVLPIVLDGDSQPLDVGRAKRTAPSGVRKALVWRDGGCSFPTCDRPSEWCDAHHVESWLDGGPTTVANMTLLCRRHHTLIHRSEWEVRIRDQLPEFLPPTFVDPERTPRRNTLHGVRSPLRKHCLTGQRAGSPR